MPDDSEEPDEADAADAFAYGERQPDGQYERHPTIDDGSFVQPVRHAYVHADGACDGALTRMSQSLAESFARAPDYYDATFCAACGDYYPVDEFVWRDTDARLGTETA